jgi:hypothetical protein
MTPGAWPCRGGRCWRVSFGALVFLADSQLERFAALHRAQAGDAGAG